MSGKRWTPSRDATQCRSWVVNVYEIFIKITIYCWANTVGLSFTFKVASALEVFVRSINYDVSELCACVSQKEAKITFSSSWDQSQMKWMCALCRCITIKIYVMSRRPCCCPETKERRPSWCPQLILRGLNSILRKRFLLFWLRNMLIDQVSENTQ